MEENDCFSHLSLLVSGLRRMVDNPDVIKSAIEEIDSQLETNSVRLQESWAELETLCNESLNPNEDLTSLEDMKSAVQLLKTFEIQDHICKSEPMVLNCFLNNVIQALERNPGLEETIFNELVNFASSQGMILPYALPLTTIDQPPETKEDAGDDNVEEEETEILWNKIRLKIKDGLWKTMSGITLETSVHHCEKTHRERRDLIQSLKFLFPLSDVWQSYIQFRHRMMEKYIISPDLIAHLETGIMCQYKDAPSNAITLAKLSRAIEIMICEDMRLLEEGNFPDCTMSFKEIDDIYLEKYMLELRAVLQAYREEKRKIAERRGSSRSTSSMSIHGDDLIVYKVCFLATVSLEMTVVKVLEQNSNHGITANVLKQTVSASSGTGRTQLPKLIHKSSKDLPVLQGWTGTPFSVSQCDFPTPRASAHYMSSPWAWREEFKHVISRISSAVVETIKLGSDSALEEQTKIYANNNALQIVHLKDELVGGPEDYPKCIAKSCSVIMARAEEVLPLASSEGTKLFQVVRSSFVDTLDSCLKTYFSSIMKIIEDFPKKCSTQTLYILLSSAVFVRNRLAQYDEVLGTEIRRPFAVLHRQYTEVVENLTNQVINYHKHIISTIILQDAESHNWTDQRPFFEDERCSFSVQMWNFHIQALQHDLWKLMPPAKAQHILTTLVQHSVSLLTLRYGNAILSYKRVTQFRSDITAILMCTLSFLWPCCSSLQVLFDNSKDETMISSIHNLCSCLLATMAFTTCPLEDLCKFLCTKKKSRKCRRGCRTDWLSWIHPEVLKTHDGSLGVLIDRQALNVLFKLMINQPLPNWSLVLQTLLLRDARLAAIIVKYGDLSVLGSPRPQDDVNPHAEHHRWCRESIPSPSTQNPASGLVYSLYHILFQTTQQSTAVVNFLIALVNREDSWRLFESKSNTKTLSKDEFPVWLNCMFITFKPYIERFVQPSLRHLCERDRKRTKSFNFTSMSSLPCGCPCVNAAKKQDSDRGDAELIFSALHDLVNQLADDLNTVPSEMFQFISVLQESLNRKNIDSTTAGIKVVGWLLCRWLSDPDCVASICDTPPSSAMLKLVDMFAEVTWHVFVHLGDGTGLLDNPKLPMNLEGHLRSSRGWLSNKIQVIMEHIVSHVGEEYQADTVHDEITDVKCTYLAKELLSDDKGAKAMFHVYHFLIDNKGWLMNLILIPGHILPPKPSSPQSQSQSLCSFNPLQKYNLIGEYDFDQEKIASFPFDWPALLQSDLGLLPPAVRKLVCNRFEMQTGAYLEEGEEVLVDKMKKLFGIKDEIEDEEKEQMV